MKNIWVFRRIENDVNPVQRILIVEKDLDTFLEDGWFKHAHEVVRLDEDFGVKKDEISEEEYKHKVNVIGNAIKDGNDLANALANIDDMNEEEVDSLVDDFLSDKQKKRVRTKKKLETKKSYIKSQYPGDS